MGSCQTKNSTQLPKSNHLSQKQSLQSSGSTLDKETFKIKLREHGAGVTPYVVDVSPFCNIACLKINISQKTGRSYKDLQIHKDVYKKIPIDNQINLKFLADSTLFVSLRMQGGGFISVTLDENSMNILSEETGEIQRKIKTFHLSCRSTEPMDWEDDDIGGIIIYDSFSNQDIRIQPGYVYVRKIDEIKVYKSSEGQIHGNLLKSLLGIEPSKVNLLCSGFGRKSGEDWKFNSLTLNTKNKELQDDRKEMHYIERDLLKQALSWWEKGGSQNVSVPTLVSICIICKRPENGVTPDKSCNGKHLFRNTAIDCQHCRNQYPQESEMSSKKAFRYFSMKVDMLKDTNIREYYSILNKPPYEEKVKQLIKESLVDESEWKE
ncbi:UNKNOWN [Stylonychia lemnae]|uniref:Uncharacterized protein n=1 Tax=Stylonychia lemnae TaxID=5949 RepID=A0A078APL8_STYLE|nr:UNKNOWN [Stylonychia lemnae]|eukprot:CDW83901.1 UNKNOWN [Stylonychia lemnae]